MERLEVGPPVRNSSHVSTLTLVNGRGERLSGKSGKLFKSSLISAYWFSTKSTAADLISSSLSCIGTVLSFVHGILISALGKKQIAFEFDCPNVRSYLEYVCHSSVFTQVWFFCVYACAVHIID